MKCKFVRGSALLEMTLVAAVVAGIAGFSGVAYNQFSNPSRSMSTAADFGTLAQNVKAAYLLGYDVANRYKALTLNEVLDSGLITKRFKL